MISLAVTNYLQMSPGSACYFFLILAKWSARARACTHTHKGPSDESLFLDKATSVKSIPLSFLLFYQENTTEKYQFMSCSGSIYLYMSVQIFHFSVSWSSEMQFGVMYLDTWGNTQPCVAFSTLVFCSCLFVYGGTYLEPNFLTLHKPVSVVSCVKSFQLACGWGLSSLPFSLKSRCLSCFL